MENLASYSLIYNTMEFRIDVFHDPHRGTYAYTVTGEDGTRRYEGADLPDEAAARRQAENAVTLNR
jgi:hypothetical protein